MEIIKPPCVYYVNLIEYTGESQRSYAIGETTESHMVASRIYDIEAKNNVIGSANCMEEICPDSIEIILFKMCDELQDYEEAVQRKVTIK